MRKRYVTKSVFLVKVDGHVEKIYGILAEAEAYLTRCGEPKNMVVDEWPVQFEENVD